MTDNIHALSPLGETLPAVVAMGERVRGYVEEGTASSTRRAYSGDWRAFCAWHAAAGLGAIALPLLPETIAGYLTGLAEEGKAVSTIRRKLAAIAFAHRLSGCDPPPTGSALVGQALKGIARKHGVAPKKKAAVSVNDLKAMVGELPASLHGIRNRALLLVGFAGAFRRSELVGLTVEAVEKTGKGLRIWIPKSKTDQAGAGDYLGIPRGKRLDTCPVRAYLAWMEASGITTGPVFRPILPDGRIEATALSGRAVARIVQEAAHTAGIDPKTFGAHSLRAGLVTAAVEAGVRDVDIMRQTRHKRVDTLYGYVRKADVFRDNPSEQVGL